MRTNKKVADSPPVFTHNGGQAKKITPIQQLERSVMSCMLFEGEFYEDGVSITKRITDLVNQVDSDKVAALALKARSEGNLRHVPLLLTKALINKRYNKVSELITAVIQRPDEMGELLSLFWKEGKVSLSAQLKKGLAQAFVKFNEYELAKYRGEGREISLRDIMFLTHPKPVDAKMAKLYKKLANKELEAAKTWEKMSSSGNYKSDKEKWEAIIDMWITE